MTRAFTLLFAALTLGAAGFTYFDVGTGLKKVTTVQEDKSVRAGSYGGVYYGGGGGGFRTGK